MSWLARRLDHLGSAAFGGAGGISLSQAPAFTQAYLQRLGGHIDEARLTIERLAAGEILPWLGATGREQAIAELTRRLEQLEGMRAALTDAPALLRPALLLTRGEWSIARNAAADFSPALPLDPASLCWTAIGIIAAVIAYELLKIPSWIRRRRREQAENQSRPPASAGRGKA